MMSGDSPATGGETSSGEGTAARLVENRLQDGIFYRHWSPPAPVAVLLLAHGAGEHCGRYRAFAEYFCARNIAVVAPDHRGHGESPGPRAHIRRFSEFFAPLDVLFEQIRRQYPSLPVFLVGHSMGGLIAARYLLSRQANFAGAVLSAPALEVPDPPSPIAIWVNRLISLVWPTLGVMQLDASGISRDAQVVADYRADPLVHSGKFSARLVTELFGAMQDVVRGRDTIRLPLLVMHGDADVMTAVDGSRHFADGVGSSDVTLRIYPGLYHEIFNEPEREAVLDDLYDWLRAHGVDG
ncbi:alpha-beta hydrolase superfamily lysophospholipase [Chromatocurvus halotolerans]|uniref:Monoacylglycerol lipase n=2 Tax=Chromatocurvus halotolerans TaxID=1132028 RepID=A0A4R2KKV9_9GAMM|nr:alpha-beta hydrolase superfamily lysophospholipase [Chromatocurvus halotolerans]